MLRCWVLRRSKVERLWCIESAPKSPTIGAAGYCDACKFAHVGAEQPKQATLYFERLVPMSKREATSEVSARLAAPGQGLSYVTGKLELYRYLQVGSAAAAAAAATTTVTGFRLHGFGS